MYDWTLYKNKTLFQEKLHSLLINQTGMFGKLNVLYVAAEIFCVNPRHPKGEG